MSITYLMTNGTDEVLGESEVPVDSLTTDSRDVLTGARMDVDVLGGAVAFRDLLASRFGPTGRKTLIVENEEIVVTSDLHRLLNKLDIGHPAARLVGASAVEQKEVIGDGSLAMVILVGGLADRATDLLNQGLQRATIADGFARAGDVAAARLDGYARQIRSANDPAVDGVAKAGLASRSAQRDSKVLDAVVEGVRLLHKEQQEDDSLGLGNIEFCHLGGEETTVELVRGTVLEKTPVSEATPTELTDAAVTIIGGGRKAGTGIEERTPRRHGGEPGEGRTEFTFAAETPDDIEALRGAERRQVDEQIDTLLAAGTDVVFCTMGISKAAQVRLVAEGIPAFRGLTSDRARRLARTVGGHVVMDLSDIDATDLGRVGRVRIVTGGDNYVRIEDCPSGEVVTLLLSGTLSESREELERDLRTAVVSLLHTLKEGEVVPGGGTIEVALADSVRTVAREVDDRTAIAMDAYADALEDIPRTLIRNAGADPIDMLTVLKARGDRSTFNTLAGEVQSIGSGHVCPYLPVRVVRATIETATDVAVQLTRIDDVLAASEDDDQTDID